MKQTLQERVAELSATLKPINDPLTPSAMEELWGEGEEFISYNGRYDIYYGTQTTFDGTANACVLQKVSEFQVVRFFCVEVFLSGECFRYYLQNEKDHEDEPDWMDNEIYDNDELEIKSVVEYKQIWINQSGETQFIDFEHHDFYNDECFVNIEGLADFACEPRIKEIILNYVHEPKTFYYTENEDPTLEFSLSKSAEYLRKAEPVFYDVIVNNYIFEKASDYYHTFRVAHRHHYSFPDNYQDAKMYLDYIKLLWLDNPEYITQPYYICPANLGEAYGRLDARRKELLILEDIRKAQSEEDDFTEQHSWLFGIEFDTEEMHFQSLDSVEAYRVEGEIMHHCIFHHEFYKKPYYLAMHITDLEGNRVATCTINLLRRKIDAIQPMCNDTGFYRTYHRVWQDTDDYKQIYQTLMARMHTFPKKNEEPIKQQIKLIA